MDKFERVKVWPVPKKQRKVTIDDRELEILAELLDKLSVVDD